VNAGPARTKIVATVGPAVGTQEAIARLIEAGTDVFRLNFSHGDRETHAQYVRDIRAAAQEAGVPIGILQDLQGPRIRTGELKDHESVLLVAGAEVTLRPGRFAGTAARLAVSYEGFATDVKPGDPVLISDGMIELEVTATDGTEARCRVIVGGRLGERKGINLPGVALGLSAPTTKDIEDLRFGVEQGVDFVALSFVGAAGDVLRVQEEIRRLGPDASIPVIAKIERPVAVENLREILMVSDGVMVARGDLGIEMPAEDVPGAQKEIIHAANRLGIPVITATQMLESMVTSPRPTRAEASDVANAILDGTDAVMLSAETSVGAYPEAAVRMMNRIARRAEELCRRDGSAVPPRIEGGVNVRQRALASAACSIADEIGAAAIVTFTMTGATAHYVSQRRPGTLVYALTPDPVTYRRLALVWGVRAVMMEVTETTDEMVEQACRRLLDLGLVLPGESTVLIAGASTQTTGGTDMLKVEYFPPEP